jgi:SagB-type dehydrogenase family enzyme
VKRSGSEGRTATRFRRSPHLVGYWHSNSLALVNFATRSRSPATLVILQILDYCGEWRTQQEIESAVSAARSPLLADLLTRLVALSLLQHSKQPHDARVRAMLAIDAWNPEAGFFHTATKDVKLVSPRRARAYGSLNPSDEPMPSVVKKYRGAPRVGLPAPVAPGPLTDVLLARRTSRRYSSSPVTLAELSTILGFAVGIQEWASTPSGEVALKTSPSGGARHSIEGYVVSRTVDALAPGIYHYRPDRHLLERIKGPVSLSRMRRYVPGSEYFASASAMVFFTSVFTREIWRYPYSRAYRATIAEAGHVCQTFLLMATSLGLASYCVMGLADSIIEADLAIDGITESVLYCAGVARMPKGKGPAMLPRGNVTTRPNEHLRARASNRS